MASFANYQKLLNQCCSLENNESASTIADLLSLRHEHTSMAIPNPLTVRLVSPPFDEMVLLHWRCIGAFKCGDYLGAYEEQINLTQTLIRILNAQKESNWFLPVMYTICQDLRYLAQFIERERDGRTEKPGEVFEKAAECLLACFRVCAADNRTSEENTKRLGMLNLVNQLFKVYFSINKLPLCKPLIRAIESSPFKDTFTLSQQITYRYYVGRKAMFDSNYKDADTYLTYAFVNCHKSSTHNKRQILIYLVPVKMLLGFIPSKKILEKYDVVTQFWDLVQAVCQGNLKRFDEIMEQHEVFFIKCGIYLIVDKLKIIAYRNLFRRVYAILETHQIPVEALQTALVSLGQTDVDLDETMCIVANLIYDGKMKGYISHQHQKVVVSKQNPFPKLSTLT